MSKLKITFDDGEIIESNKITIEAIEEAPSAAPAEPEPEEAAPERKVVTEQLMDFWERGAYRLPIEDNAVYNFVFRQTREGRRNFRTGIMTGLQLFTPQEKSGRAPIEMALYRLSSNNEPELVQEDLAGQLRVSKLPEGDYSLVLDIIDQKDREWGSTLVLYA